MAVKRFDSGTLGNVERTPQGGVRIPAYPTRAGVLKYRNADGSERLELRHPDDVFDPKSLRTLRGAPITDLHPAEMVTPANFKSLSVGHVSDEITREGYLAGAFLIVQDATEIELIDNGDRKECSCGYTCDIDPTPGVFDGQPYDVRQINIEYNHVGIGPEGWGRAGSSVALRLDAGDAMSEHIPKSEASMPGKLVRVDGIEYEAGSEGHLQAIAKVQATAEATIVEQRTTIDRLNKEKIAETSRADAAEKSLKETQAALVKATDPKTIHAMAKTRADMLDKGRAIAKLRGVKFDLAAAEGVDEAGLMIQILKMIEPDFNPEGQDPKVVAGYAMGRIKAALDAGKTGGTAPAETEAAEEMIDGEDTEEEDPNNPKPPMPPARSDSRDDIYGARQRASKDTGTGPSRLRTDKKDTPEAAEQRLRQDSSNAWQGDLAFSRK